MSIIIRENVIEPYLYSKAEGFEDGSGPVPGAVQENKGLIQWMDNSKLYDSFYAGIYDQLTQGSVRTQAEVGLLLNEWTSPKKHNSVGKENLETFEILDAGCGTGIAVAAFGKIGCKRVVGR